MKKTLLITFGTILILLIVGVWLYLFINGAPKNAGEVFSNFGFGEKSAPVFSGGDSPSVVDTAVVTDSGAPQRLRQLTTRPVAGAVFIDGGIRYVERGTGNVYDVMFNNGKELLVSNTTIPRAVDALFSTDGERVAIIYEENGSRKTVVGSVVTNGEGFDGKVLPAGAREVAFNVDQDAFDYLLSVPDGSSGYKYNMDKNTSTELFSIPLRDIHVLWGNSIYVYTSPSASQNGYLYRVDKNKLTFVTSGAPGLSAILFGEGYVVSTLINSVFGSEVHSTTSIYPLPISLFPEKCVSDMGASGELFCAAPQRQLSGEYPDLWYKGVSSLNDLLWFVDTTNQSVRVLSNPVMEMGREIDVAQIGMSSEKNSLWFINKNDDTLWMFDLSVTPSVAGGGQ